MVIAIGEEYEKIALLTSPYIKQYAQKVKADLIFIKERKYSLGIADNMCICYEKSHIYELLLHYDRVVYWDIDLLVRNDCPNLFDIVPFESIGLFNGASYCTRKGGHLRERSVQYIKKTYRKAYSRYHIPWDSRYLDYYYSAGNIVLSNIHRDIWRAMPNETIHDYDQAIFNLRMLTEGPYSVFELDYRFNHGPMMEENRWDSFIINYAGGWIEDKRPKAVRVLENIENDIEIWTKKGLLDVL